MTTTTYPGFYKINQITVYPTKDSEPRNAFDIGGLVTDISIEESIVNDSVRGVIKVLDSAGLLESYPLRGEEKLYLEIEDAVGNKKTYFFLIYKIDNVAISETNDKLSYLLHIVSYQRFYADTHRIVQYYENTASNIAQDIFNKTYKTARTSRPVGTATNSSQGDENKEISIEPTEGILKCIMPNYTPLQALKFLESRSYSSTSPSCSFRFFESADKFYFASDEYLFKTAILNDKVFNFTFSDGLSQAPIDLLNRMSNMLEIRNPDRVDTFDDLHGGGYKNKVISVNIINKTANILEPAYTYLNERSKYFNLTPGQSLNDRHSDSFITSYFTDENCRKFIFMLDHTNDTAGELRGEEYIPQIVSNRLAYRTHLDSIKVFSKSPGRFDITCGDFIRLNLPVIQAAGVLKSYNIQLSGVYLVESITRSFDTSNMFTNSYVLIKRDWAERVDSRVETFLSTGLGGL